MLSESAPSSGFEVLRFSGVQYTTEKGPISPKQLLDCRLKDGSVPHLIATDLENMIMRKVLCVLCCKCSATLCGNMSHVKADQGSHSDLTGEQSHCH